MIYNEMRPHRFDDVKGQAFVVENIRNQSKKDCFFPVFILCGQYGSGKTTMARLIAMAANCTHKDENGNPCGECEACLAVLNHSPEGIIEIDGASNNGVEDVRKLLANADTLGIFKKKVIVIDEAHMLSKNAFNALLITLENPPEHCIFILCTTEKDALPDTVVSRAPVYTFGKISDPVIKDHILEVAGKSDIRITADAAGMIARYADGAMRNALQILEHLSLQNEQGQITDQDVISILGLSSTEQQVDFIKACLQADIGKIYGILCDCEKSGIALTTFLSDTLRMATDLLLHLAGSQVIGSTYYLECLDKLSIHGEWVAGRLCRLFSHLTNLGNRSLSSERIMMEVLSVFRTETEEMCSIEVRKAATETPEESGIEETILGTQKTSTSDKKETLESSEPAENKLETSSEGTEKESFKEVDEKEIPFEVAGQEINTSSANFNSMFGGMNLFGFSNVMNADSGKKERKKEKKATVTGFGVHFSPAVATGKPERDSEELALSIESKKSNLQERMISGLGPESSSDTDFVNGPGDIEMDEESYASEEVISEHSMEETSDELAWEDMANMGLMLSSPFIPVPATEEELDKEYGGLSAKNLSQEQEEVAASEVPSVDEIEEEDLEVEDPPFRTKADLHKAEETLNVLLKNPGFRVCYNNARVIMKDYEIFLVYKNSSYYIASKAFTTLKKGIHSVREGEI